MGKSTKTTVKKQKGKQIKDKEEFLKSDVFSTDKKYWLIVALLAIVSGYLSSQHVSNMFENQKQFSHLSTLERELSFRTEMGLYYSYYKTIAEAPTYMSGVRKILKCNITEYPDEINVLRRFNLYPELVLGTMFRIYKWYGKLFNMRLETCYTINRGEGLSQVQSCVGMGDIAHFYVYPIFWLNGLMLSAFFILGTYISGSILGGAISVICFFYNWGEATRVQWTPPLRESFSFPFLIAQLLTIVHLLKCPSPNLRHSVLLSIITTCFMLPWQFAQFALLTQVCAIFGLYLLKFIDSKRITIILYGLLLSHYLNFVFQLANTLLISSFFMAAMISALVVIKLEVYFEKLPHRILIWVSQAGFFLFMSVVIKVGTAKLFQIKDDAHIFDILKSKFSDFKDFHTLLYVCAPEFDFLGFEYANNVSKTLLLPTAIFVGFVVLVKILINEWKYWICNEKIMENSECPTKPYTEHFYWLLQTVAFMIMSVMIMRLKLFGTPSLCILASLLASKQIFGFIGQRSVQYSVIFLLLAGMTYQGYKNLNHQFSMKGSYSNVEMENLIEWINANTEPDAVFAGAMPTMAGIKLSCNRPIVNHPHYEDVGLRERTKRVYQMYSRKKPSYYHKEMIDMGVTYVILETSWCNRRQREGCGLPEVWDNEDFENLGRPALCNVLSENPRPFHRVWTNGVYQVLKV
nr:probable C-mannosyltransferase DPY19L1 [Hydra vulgaris]